MKTFEFSLGECNELAHCFFGNDEKCRCGRTNRRQSVEANLARAEAKAARLLEVLSKVALAGDYGACACCDWNGEIEHLVLTTIEAEKKSL